MIAANRLLLATLLLLGPMSLAACDDAGGDAPPGEEGPGGSGGSGGGAGGSGGSAGGGGAGGALPPREIRDPQDFQPASSAAILGWRDIYFAQSTGRELVYRTLPNDSDGQCFSRAADADCDFDLYAFDPASGESRPVVATPHREEEFTVDGDRVWFLDYLDDSDDSCLDRAGDPDCDVQLSWRSLSGPGGGRTRFSQVEEGAVNIISADGGRVAAGLYTGTGGTDIRILFDDGSPTDLAVTGPAQIFELQLRGSRLIWSDLSADANGGCFSTAFDRDCTVTITAFDLTTRRTAVVTREAVGSKALFPRICGDFVLYPDLARDSNTACAGGTDPDCAVDLVAHDLRTGESRTVQEGDSRFFAACDGTRAVLTTPGADTNGLCFWSPEDADCLTRVELLDLETGEVRPVATAAATRGFADLRGDLLSLVEIPDECYIGTGADGRYIDAFCPMRVMAVDVSR